MVIMIFIFIPFHIVRPRCGSNPRPLKCKVNMLTITPQGLETPTTKTKANKVVGLLLL